MNARTIIAADGLPRRAFTVADVTRMVEVGLIGADERIELIDGELIPMSPKGNRHELIKNRLLRHWARRAADTLELAAETTLRFAPDSFVEPDLLIFPRAVGYPNLDGRSVLLAVEVANSSLGYDLGRKAFVYAAHGVPELWVIDVVRLVIHVHREPGREGYAKVTPWHAGDLVVPHLVPGLSLRLADLDLAELAEPDFEG